MFRFIYSRKIVFVVKYFRKRIVVVLKIITVITSAFQMI